jgi:hypothetical protein
VKDETGRSGFVCTAVVALAPVSALADGTTFLFQTVISPGDPAFTQLLGIKNGGTIAGYLATVPSSRTWFYSDPPDKAMTTTVTQLPRVNNTGVAAGYWTDAAGNFHPFTFSGAPFTGINFAGKISAPATGVNNAGMVVGFNMTRATTSEGFSDNAGVFTFLPFPGSVFTQALGLNNDGEIVGCSMDAAGNTHGFLCNIAAATYQQVYESSRCGSRRHRHQTGSTTTARLWASSQTPTVMSMAWVAQQLHQSPRRCFCWHRPSRAHRDSPPHHQTAHFRSKLRQS